MFSVICISIILAILPTPITMQFGKISAYCHKSQSGSLWSYYPPTPVECCTDDKKCPIYILPGESKFGVTNESQDWWIRSCDCDLETLRCVIDGSKPHDAPKAMRFLLNEKCIQTLGGIPCKPRSTNCKMVPRSTNIVSFEDSVAFTKFLQDIHSARPKDRN